MLRSNFLIKVIIFRNKMKEERLFCYIYESGEAYDRRNKKMALEVLEFELNEEPAEDNSKCISHNYLQNEPSSSGVAATSIIDRPDSPPLLEPPHPFFPR